MATPADQLFGEIAADVAAAMERVGGEIVDAVREDLGVPVGVTAGPRGGKVIERSKPGEHPRRETGALQAGVYREIERDGLRTKLAIGNTVEYAKWLDPLGEQGLKDRPIVDDVLDRFEEQVCTAIAQAISSSE